MRSRTLKLAIVVPVLALAVSILAPTKAPAQKTPTEIIADCINGAWQQNYACQNDGNWLNDVPCAIKFEADAILCTGAIF